MKNLIHQIKLSVTLRFLHQLNREYLKKYPQMAIFSFDYIGNMINVFGKYELDELEYLTSNLLMHEKDNVALDIGANIGNHTVALAPFFKKVLSFEPNFMTYQLLKFNSLNFPNVSTFNFGASNTDAKVRASYEKDNIGGATIVKLGNGSMDNNNYVNFEVRQLDSFAEVSCAGFISFVKIDAEGHEIEALQGAQNILKHYSPIIAFEQNAGEITDGNSNVLSFLKAVGYEYFYELSQPRRWRTSSRIPIFVRNPLCVIESLIFGLPKRHKMVRVKILEKRNYSMILASKNTINVPRTTKHPPT